MTALNSEELSHLRLPTSTTAAVVSGTTGASFLTTTLHFTTPAPGFNLPQSNIHAGTSGGYDEGKPSQQGSSQDSIIRATNAATIAWMPLTSQPSSSTVYTHSDPLSWLYISEICGQNNLLLCNSNSHRFIQCISSLHHTFCTS